MYAQTIRPVNLSLGAWKDTWNEWKDKYDDTFNPEQETPLKPAGTVTTTAPAKSEFMGIPSTWLLYGGLGAIGVAAAVILARKNKSGKPGKKSKK
jgi:hypothetical protein